MNDEECFHKLYWIIQSYSFSVRVSELLQQVHRHNFLKGNSHSITRHNLPSPNIKWPTTEKNRERKYTYFLPTSLLPKHFPFSIFIVFRGQFYASCWRFRPNCIFLSFPLAVLILSHKIISLKMTLELSGAHLPWEPPLWYMPKLCTNTPAEGPCTPLNK